MTSNNNNNKEINAVRVLTLYSRKTNMVVKGNEEKFVLVIHTFVYKKVYNLANFSRRYFYQ